MRDTDLLIPELALWNNGRGIDPLDWLHTFAKADVAVGFSYLFWPGFVVFEGYVFRDGFSEQNLRDWQKPSDASPKSVEAGVNTLHLDDLFSGAEEWTPLLERQCIHLVEVLADVHRVKLARDFPGRAFEVDVFDGAQDGGDISLSFWQI